VLGVFKDQLIEKANDFKEFEERKSWSNYTFSGHALIIFTFYLLDDDEESLKLPDDLGTFVFTCPSIENESNKCL